MLNLDKVLNRLGVKMIFLYHDFDFEKQKDNGYDLDGIPLKKFFCELSWNDCHCSIDGCQTEDSKIEFATNASGDTPGEAIQKCIDVLYDLIKDDYKEALQVAKLFNLSTDQNKDLEELK